MSASTHPRVVACSPHWIKNRRPSSTACCQSAASHRGELAGWLVGMNADNDSDSVEPIETPVRLRSAHCLLLERLGARAVRQQRNGGATSKAKEYEVSHW
jgi:hypothetical protein